jgi:hypothetical protein
MLKKRVKFNLESKRQLLLISIALSLFVALFFMDPIAQDQAYHQFADQNTLFSIPNFWNVVSNLPFIFVGILGLTAIRKRSVNGSLPELQIIYSIFFAGLIFTGFGSSYYHWNPNNASLVWDRLPMTISFMAFFTVVLGENISLTFAKRAFYPLLIIGFFTVIYWFITESKGAGDLRPYVLVQFLPVIMIPLILWLYKSPFTGQRYILAVLAAYVLAKLLEHFDHEVFGMLGVMSGHAIKHVIAALGTFFFYLALKKRKLR